MMAYYDVKYILGGSEKKVLETYIQCVGSDGKSARQACPRDLFTVTAPEVSVPCLLAVVDRVTLLVLY